MKRARTERREQSASQKRKQRKIRIVMENATRDVVASQMEILAEAKAKLDAGATPEELDLAYRLRFVRAKAEHRAGSCYLYNDAPAEVRNGIGARIMVVKVVPRDGYIEVLGWSPDYEPVTPGAGLPHYRWMYDTATSGELNLTCMREDAQNALTQPLSLPIQATPDREGDAANEPETAHAAEEVLASAPGRTVP